MQPTIGDRLARIRRQAGITQEQLAEAAGLSVETVRKLESNQRTAARIATLAALARALDVPTTALLGSAVRAAAHRERNGVPLGLVELRRALTPIRGLDGVGPTSDPSGPSPTADAVRAAVVDANHIYHANRYDSTLAALPGLIGDARALVDVASDDDQRQTAHILASRAHQLAGRLMIQMRHVDLAHTALSLALDHAERSGDRVAAAVALTPMCWLLLRQARVAEAVELAVRTADQIEPRMSRAEPAEVAVWGELYMRAAAGAARDNRPADASHLLDLAATAAARLGGRTDEVIATGGIDLSAAAVAFMRVETSVITGAPDRALQLAAEVPAVAEQATPSSRQRHRLDVAAAHVARQEYADATAVLVDLRDRAPMWLRHQRYARDIVSTIATERRRAMGEELSQLASLVGATV